MGVTSTQALITALYEALTTSTGKTRALAAEHLFARAKPPGTTAKARFAAALEQKRVFVSVSAPEVFDDSHTEMADEHHYLATVAISRDYAIGSEQHKGEIEASMVLIADDFMRLRSALCWPGALDTTAVGDDTGLASKSLEASGAKDSVSIAGSARLVTAVARFRAHILFSPDGA